MTDVSDKEVRVQRVDRVSGRDEAPSFKTWNLREGLHKPVLQVGDRWTEPTFDGDRVAGSATYTVKKRDRISTKAGRFEAFQIDTKVKYDAENFRQIFWFAPEVGNVVKLIYVGNGSHQVTELTCFARGGALSCECSVIP